MADKGTLTDNFSFLYFKNNEQKSTISTSSALTKIYLT